MFRKKISEIIYNSIPLGDAWVPIHPRIIGPTYGQLTLDESITSSFYLKYLYFSF